MAYLHTKSMGFDYGLDISLMHRGQAYIIY